MIRKGQITSVTGATTLLGSDPQKGDHFKAIHNSRVREVVALAHSGEISSKSRGSTLTLQETISSFSTRLPDGQIVVFWGPRQSQHEAGRKQGGLDLKDVLESLPVPVLLDNEVSPGTVPGTSRRGLATRMVRPSGIAPSRLKQEKSKALRLRWGKKTVNGQRGAFL